MCNGRASFPPAKDSRTASLAAFPRGSVPRYVIFTAFAIPLR